MVCNRVYLNSYKFSSSLILVREISWKIVEIRESSCTPCNSIVIYTIFDFLCSCGITKDNQNILFIAICKMVNNDLASPHTQCHTPKIHWIFLFLFYDICSGCNCCCLCCLVSSQIISKFICQFSVSNVPFI